ncbi:hypothetical protein BC827DRAFT_1203673 [Russula dissimulans]|nr:hypothetical protein BC827DRAFT_1203673 [Russula dissimulans]
MALSPPFPPSGRFIEYVRESSRTLTQTEAVKISDANIERLLLSSAFTETYHRITATSHGHAFPFKFSSPLSELNLLSILALLNFGSGYRAPLHREIGRGAWDSIRAFVIGLYLSSATDGEGNLLGARGMQTLSEAKIAELLGVSLYTERPHESIQGLTVGKMGGPGWELVQLLKTTLDETGQVLVNGGYPDLGSFVAEALKEGARVAHEKADSAVAADIVLERLVRAIPGFRDMSIVNDQPIFCFKKALFLINAVSVRFGTGDPSPFPVPQTSHLPVFADNVLPSILIHLGIIDLSTAAPALARLFPAPTTTTATTTTTGSATTATPSGDPALLLLPASPEPAAKAAVSIPAVVVDGPVLTPAQAYVLRAAAIEACERIVAHARAMSAAGPHDGSPGGASWLKDVSLPDIDIWLWAVAKDRADYRALPRFVLRNTSFF